MVTTPTNAQTTRERLGTLLSDDLSFQAPAREAHPLHALHPFAARFPHSLASHFINGLTQHRDTVLDPMCGSGITLLEGWQAGRSVIGVDIDPLARRQSTARTSVLKPQAIRSSGDAVLQRAALLYTGIGNPPDPLAAIRHEMDYTTLMFLDYWFFPHTQQELAALVLAIRREPDLDLRNLLEVIFSSIIVTKSGGVSRARDLAHTRPHRVADKTPRRPIPSFAVMLNRAVNAYAAISPASVGNRRIIAGDARSLPLDSSTVELIVTSPPYANALDYMRAHKFSLAWLGDPIPNLTSLRAQYIGSESNTKNTGTSAAAELPSTVQSVVDELAIKDVPKARVLHRYFTDMSASVNEMARVLRPGAAAVIVVGPSTMRGITIPTHQCLAELAAHAELDVIGVAPRNLDRDRRMMPARNGSTATTASGIERRMHTEYIIGAIKPP